MRGSRLSPEDKKRVLVEAGAESGGTLTMQKVQAAVRMLGSSFFQEMTSGKKEKSLKTYDSTAFVAEEDNDEDPDWSFHEEYLDEENLEAWAQDDPDAALVVQFEAAIQDVIQDDQDLSAYFSSYQDARRRLQDRVKARGFWSGGKGASSSKGFKGKGKGKGFKGSKGFRSLQQRIAESYCRHCNQKGHWRAECPVRKSAESQGSGSEKNAYVAPTSAAVSFDLNQVPEISFENNEHPEDTHVCVFGLVEQRVKFFEEKFKTKLRAKLQIPVRKSRDACLPEVSAQASPSKSDSIEELPSLFASVGTTGVVDLGASQTVIGSEQVSELLNNLPSEIQRQARKTKCNLIFKFGNHQTLPSKVALLLPHSHSHCRGEDSIFVVKQFLETCSSSHRHRKRNIVVKTPEPKPAYDSNK